MVSVQTSKFDKCKVLRLAVGTLEVLNKWDIIVIIKAIVLITANIFKPEWIAFYSLVGQLFQHLLSNYHVLGVMVRLWTWSTAVDWRPQGKDEGQLEIQPCLRSGAGLQGRGSRSFQGPAMLGSPLLGRPRFAQIWSLCMSETTRWSQITVSGNCMKMWWGEKRGSDSAPLRIWSLPRKAFQEVKK